VALDAASIALGDLVFGEGREQSGGGPAFLVGAFGKGGPDLLDRGQPQLIEQQRQVRRVEIVVHAGTPTSRLTRAS
jgi:hypothetical protein